MPNKNHCYDSDLIFAAIKLIENLYKNGYITQNDFKSILDDYKDCVDISKFRIFSSNT